MMGGPVLLTASDAPNARSTIRLTGRLFFLNVLAHAYPTPMDELN